MIIIQSYFVNEHSTVWNQRIKIVDFVLNEKKKKKMLKRFTPYKRHQQTKEYRMF